MTTDAAEKEPTEPKRRTGLWTFMREVRAEGRKVTWATRQEVTVSTIMVVIFAIMAGIFFFIVDQILRLVVDFVLGL
ncbi:MAG: preprotein translocase subunit SecE [Caulobacterales bacterium]|jgi:preprotein translocase subunit SecE